MTQPHPNGVDVQNLVATIEAVKNDPALAEFQFRASTKWHSGAHVRTIKERGGIAVWFSACAAVVSEKNHLKTQETSALPITTAEF